MYIEGVAIQVKPSFCLRAPKPEPPNPQDKKNVCRNLFGTAKSGDTDELIREENNKTLQRAVQLCGRIDVSVNKYCTELIPHMEEDLITKEIKEYEAKEQKKNLNVNKKDIRGEENLSPTSLQESQEKTPKAQICKRKISTSYDAKPHVQQQEITEYFPLRKNLKTARLEDEQTIGTGSESTTNSAITTTTATISTESSSQTPLSTTTSSSMSSETPSIPTTTSSSPHL